MSLIIAHDLFWCFTFQTLLSSTSVSLQASCSIQKATQNVAGGSELSLLFFRKFQFKNLFDTVLADDTGYAGSNVLLTVFAVECGGAGPDELLVVEDSLNQHAGSIGNTEFRAALAVNLNIAGSFNLQLQIVQTEGSQLRTFGAQLGKALAADANGRPDNEAGITVFAHAEGLNGFAAVACCGAEYTQQTVAFKAGAGAEATIRLPVHLAADMLADNVCRIGNADHNAFKVNLLQMADNLVGHLDGIVKHIQACFTGTAAAAEGHYQNIGIVELAVFTCADFGVVTAKRRR